jgi:glutamine amidotransferase
MCIIVYKPRRVSVERRTLEACFANNPDGAGFMFPREGLLIIKKGYFEFGAFWAAWERHRRTHGEGGPVVFHFRIATAGGIDRVNCHPHRIAPDLGFVHNGVLSRVRVPKGSNVSDTIIYRDRHLRNLAGQSLRNAKLFRMIGRHIGAANKFVFMNGAGAVVICNEKRGVWRDGLWFSNRSFMPRSGFSFLFRHDEWLCKCCGKALEAPGEFDRGVRGECLAWFEPGYAECGGCRRILLGDAHRAAGWCDDCGFEIYGPDWPNLLRGAANRPEEHPRDCF